MLKFLKYKPELNRKEIAACRRGFDTFAVDGIMDPNQMLDCMKMLKFDEQEPVIYDVIAKFAETHKNVNFDEFVDGINEILQDRGSNESTQRSFDLFVEDPNGTVTVDVLKRVTKEVGDDDSDEKLQKMIEGGAENKKDIGYEEFHKIMTKTYSLNPDA